MLDTAEIFVSYNREDRAFVANLVKELEDSGYSVWWDTRISAGSEFDSAIENALAAARCVVVVWSDNSVGSEWVKNEASEGLRRNILIPVRIDDVDLPLAFRRRQTIDMADLESLARVSEEVARVIGSDVAVESGQSPHTHRRRRTHYPSFLVHVIYIALFSCVFAAGFWFWPEKHVTPPGMQVPLSLQPYYHYPGQEQRIALSPDGRQIAFIGLEAGDTFLYMQDVGIRRATKLPGTDGATAPFFSPNGKWIGFYAHGKLKRSPSSGGNPVDIASVDDLKFGASWGDDDFIVFSNGYRNPLSRVRVSGGEIDTITSINKDESHRHPFVLPGSGAILYQAGGPRSAMSIWVRDLGSGESHYVTEGYYPHYLDGKLLFQRGHWSKGSIWAVDFDPETLTVTGNPLPLFEETHSPFTISTNGALIFSSLSRAHYNLLLLDQSTGETRMIIEERSSAPSFSPDGKSLAVVRTLNGQPNIWIYDLTDKGSESQLSFKYGHFPVWSPDGTQLAYWELGTGIMTQRLDTSESMSIKVEFEGSIWPSQWSDEGILSTQLNDLTAGDLHLVTENGHQQIILGSDHAEIGGKISPNGAWLAWNDRSGGDSYVYLGAYPPDGGRRHRVEVTNAAWPTWSADGSALYVTSLNRLMRVPVMEKNGITLGEPRLVYELGGPEGPNFDVYDVSPDESQIVMMNVTYPAPPVQVLVTDWRELLDD